MTFTWRKTGRCIALYGVIYPFLFVVGIIDFIIGLIIPYKYEDNELPDKDAVLSKITDPTDKSSAFRSTLFPDLIRIEDRDTNLYKEFSECVKSYFDFQTMGVREILSIDDEKQPNGKIFKKYSLGNYKWMKYEDLLTKIDNFSNGLLNIGLKSDMSVVIFAETRPEWLTSAFSCFRIKAPLVTLYSTLGVDALAYGINQTNSSYMITSGEQLPKIQKILNKIPNLTHLIVLNDKFTEKNFNDFKKNATNLTVYKMDELVEIGKNSDKKISFVSPKKDDLAVIMYTSGSTGNPKGVMISHGNLITAVRGLRTRLGTAQPGKDIYVAYLPLAHVLELVCEMTCIMYGIRIGYSTPQTIADNSTAIKKGQKGDLRILKPTIMASVPIVLERLSKTVYEKLSQTSWFTQTLFKMAYKQKLEYFRAKRSTRLLDRVLFKRISRAVLGGKCRLMLSGGAILSKEVHEFAQVIFCPTIQAYGLTETCGAATTQLPNQTDNDVVGSLAPCSELRLVDWAEAGYRNTDTPNPRGEIYLGGEHITMGYYNMPDKTAEDYKVINGVRYFATGDIGEMLPNGDLKIIDRKKDLVKLQGGEYVSLNKVESFLKLMPLVDNVCVIADGLKSNTVCLVCPNPKKLSDLLKEEDKANGIEVDSKEIKPVADLILAAEKNKKFMEKMNKEILDHCLAQSLERFEIPTRVKFVKEIWMPDTGLVTDSLKLKRKEIEKFYKSEIAELYKS